MASILYLVTPGLALWQRMHSHISMSAIIDLYHVEKNSVYWDREGKLCYDLLLHYLSLSNHQMTLKCCLKTFVVNYWSICLYFGVKHDSYFYIYISVSAMPGPTSG